MKQESSVSLKHIDSLLLICGTSGAGKSSALHALSDYGYYVIENLPTSLFASFIEISRLKKERYTRTALIIDTGTEKEVNEFINLLEEIKISLSPKKTPSVTLVFLDCGTNTLLKRYSETRRPHPSFSSKHDSSLDDTIKKERRLLENIKEHADLIIDTSDLSTHSLRKRMKMLAEKAGAKPDLIQVTLVSFGYKHGTPRDCDLVVDIRFLPNPYFVHALRDKNGLDTEVADYVIKSKEAQIFMEKYFDLLIFLLSSYAAEGKFYVTIGIGCTGGKHRSVAVAEKLGETLKALDKISISILHRDIKR